MATRKKAKPLKLRRAKSGRAKARLPKVKAKPKAAKRAAARSCRKAAKAVARKVRPALRKPAAVAQKKAGTAAAKRVRAQVKGRLSKHLENTHIRNLLTEVAGEKALKVAGEMTEPLSDEEIAKCAGAKISEIRAVLNKLHAAGIAVYDRTRNDEGWYTYTWRLTMDNAFRMVEEKKGSEKIGKAKNLMESATDHYRCPACFERTGARLNFEQAVEAGFRCPDCTEMLHYVEKKR